MITQRGRAAAIILSPEAYERSRQERELLRLLARGEREVAQGKGHSLDSVLREVDGLLEGLDYIRRDKPSAARRLRRRVEDALRRLEDHPESGRRIPELSDLA